MRRHYLCGVNERDGIDISIVYTEIHVRGEKRCVSGRDERGLGDWFGGQGVGRGLVEGGGKTKRFAGVKGF